MGSYGLGGGVPRGNDPRREVMLAPDEVSAMVRLQALGWGTRRIAVEFGCSRNTVKRHLEAGGWSPYRAQSRRRRLRGMEAWLGERFRQHRGNADVVRQELEREHGMVVSLRTVERAVRHLRQELKAEASATVRFETPPGKQLQIDFGVTRVAIGSESTRVCLFVATLGYSRRTFVRAFGHERQSAWLEGVEAAFRHFGGVTCEVLLDNARALVSAHDAVTREVVFNERLHAFADYWGFRPRACAPYRARTKGKDERGVGYVKRNAIAGHAFASWAALEGHLDWWMREVADRRVHGTTGEAPIERFRREEADALRAIDGRPPFRQLRDLVRRVQSDCVVEVDTNSYSVPWRLIGENVQVVVSGGRVRVMHAGVEVAVHAETVGRRQRVIEPAHFLGVAGFARPIAVREDDLDPPLAEAALLRPLAEYERLVGGGW